MQICRSRTCFFVTAIAILVAYFPRVLAQTFKSPLLNQVIPDGDFVGMTHTIKLENIPATPVADVMVSLRIEGSFVGDLFAQLVHDGGQAVLLNRVGKSLEMPQGYSEGAIDIEFSDSAALGDVHDYRFTLNGSHAMSLEGSLTGTWAPDGRNVDPISVLDTNPRTSLLGDFVGSNPNGNWTLFIADVDRGAEHRLMEWGLHITPIPEPKGLMLFAGVVWFAFGIVHRRIRRNQD